MRILIVFSLIFAAVLAAPVMAQLTGNPPYFCRNGAFPRDAEVYRIGRIAGRGPAYFYDDADEDCPRAPRCRTKSYVVGGDEVIVSREYDGFACAWFASARGSETVGWIDLRRLSVEPPKSAATRAEWLGDWKFYDNEISVRAGKGTALKFSGNAFWRGSVDNVHTGEIDYSVAKPAAVVEFGEEPTEEYGCRVTARLAGRFMIVSDNMNCGGVNVTFSGVYVRSKSKK